MSAMELTTAQRDAVALSGTSTNASAVHDVIKSGHRVVIRSPGQVDMVGLCALARALAWPVGRLAKMAYHAPSVLTAELDRERAVALADACRQLGLDVVAETDRDPVIDTGERFDVAVHIVDPAAVGHAVDVTARVIGVDREQAHRMLATPPGTLIGDISRASVNDLAARFGDGVEVRVAASGQGPFDVVVSHEAPSTPDIERLCGDQRGLFVVGLDRDAADRLCARIPKGSVRLVARDLVRFDLVFGTGGEMGRGATDWLREHFGVGGDRIGALRRCAPIALAEQLAHPDAAALEASGRAAGVPVSLQPSGFGRYVVSVASVVSGADPSVVADLVRQMRAGRPDRFPAVVGTNLTDLEARWLAHELEAVGAIVAYEET